jgi:hypothetical protein
MRDPHHHGLLLGRSTARESGGKAEGEKGTSEQG